MSLADIQRIHEFSHQSQMHGTSITIMGGEPTVHPRFVDIMHLLRRLNPSHEMQVLTNLLCDPALLKDLAPLGVGALINVGGYLDNTEEQKQQLHANLELLGRERIFRGTCLAVTIVDPDQDFEFLYDILRQDEAVSIGAVRIGISSPGTGFANRFPREFSTAYGDKYLEIVERVHQIRPLFVFANECFVNMCMMSEPVYNRLVRVVKGLDRYCSANLDILPDFSTHWCFAFQEVPEMRIQNIFDYRNLDDVYNALCAKASKMERELGTVCDTTHCKCIECLGPCLGMKYYLKYVKK